MRIAIMTDSNTGMSNAEAKELGVYLLPMPVIIDGNVYFEGQNLTTEEFFSSLEEGKDVKNLLSVLIAIFYSFCHVLRVAGMYVCILQFYLLQRVGTCEIYRR